MSTNNGSQIVKQVARLDSVQTCLILFVHSVKHQPKHHPKQCLIVFGRQPFPVRTGLQSLENAVIIVPGDTLVWRNSSFKDPRLLLELLLFKTSQGNVLTELTLHSNVHNLYMWKDRLQRRVCHLSGSVFETATSLHLLYIPKMK